MACYLCQDTEEEGTTLYKICVCEDSLLCLECLKLTEENLNKKPHQENKSKCSICRRQLKIFHELGDTYLKKVGIFILIKIGAIVTEIYPPLYIHNLKNQTYPTELYSSNSNFLISIIAQSIIIRYFIKKLYHEISVFQNPENIVMNHLSYLKLDMIYIFLINIFMIGLFNISHDKTSDVYTIMVILPIYYLPFSLLLIICIMMNLINSIDELQRKFSYKKITLRNLVNIPA